VPSPILSTGAGAAAGLQDLIAQQRDTEWKRLQDQARSQELAERERANRADEAYRGQQLQQTGAYQQNMLASLDKDRADRAADRAADNTRLANQDIVANIALRPIGSPVSIEEQTRELAAGVPSGRYGTERTFGPPLSGGEGEQGPAMPTIPDLGSEAQRLAWLREQNDAEQAAATAATAAASVTRAENAAAETARHNRVMESQGTTREERLRESAVIWVRDPNNPAGPAIPMLKSQVVEAGAKAPASQALQTQVTKNEASTQELDRLEAQFKPEYVGLFAGPGNVLKSKLPALGGLNPPDEGFSDFKATTAAVRNKIINAITGASVGGTQEATRIMDQIPGESDQPHVWRSKLKATRRNLADLEIAMANIAAGGKPGPVTGLSGSPKVPTSDGQSTTSPPPATGTAKSAPKMGERRQFPQGIGEWDGQGWKPVP
jgi:hypothetical protein